MYKCLFIGNCCSFIPNIYILHTYKYAFVRVIYLQTGYITYIYLAYTYIHTHTHIDITTCRCIESPIFFVCIRLNYSDHKWNWVSRWTSVCSTYMHTHIYTYVCLFMCMFVYMFLLIFMCSLFCIPLNYLTIIFMQLLCSSSCCCCYCHSFIAFIQQEINFCMSS